MARWDAARRIPPSRAASAGAAIRSTLRCAHLNDRRSGGSAAQPEPLRKISAIEIIPGVGHFPQLEAAQTVNRLITEFAAACR
jgi:hypothetical protein